MRDGVCRSIVSYGNGVVATGNSSCNRQHTAIGCKRNHDLYRVGIRLALRQVQVVIVEVFVYSATFGSCCKRSSTGYFTVYAQVDQLTKRMIQKVTNYLDSIGVSYQLLRHEAVVTTEESRKVIHVEGCMACKSLYVKDKKSDNYYLVVLPFDKRANMRGLASCVGCAKFEFATEDKLWQDLQVHRGSVSPFAFLNERANFSAPLIIDADVWYAPKVKFHPCDNTATVVLSGEDLRKFVGSINKRVVVV